MQLTERRPLLWKGAPLSPRSGESERDGCDRSTGLGPGTLAESRMEGIEMSRSTVLEVERGGMECEPQGSSDITRFHPAGRAWIVDHVGRRRWPLVVTLMLVSSTMAYSFFWYPVVHHSQIWITPGDVWSTFRAAHWVGWGNIGGVYGSDSQLVTFPGIAVLLAPIAMISNGLGLTESLAPVFLDHPTAWLVLGPAIALLGSTCCRSRRHGRVRRCRQTEANGSLLDGRSRPLPGNRHLGPPRRRRGAGFGTLCTDGDVREALVAVRTSVGGGDRRPASRHPSVSDGVCARSPWESCHGDPGRRPSIRTPD